MPQFFYQGQAEPLPVTPSVDAWASEQPQPDRTVKVAKVDPSGFFARNTPIDWIGSCPQPDRTPKRIHNLANGSTAPIVVPVAYDWLVYEVQPNTTRRVAKTDPSGFFGPPVSLDWLGTSPQPNVNRRQIPAANPSFIPLVVVTPIVIPTDWMGYEDQPIRQSRLLASGLSVSIPPFVNARRPRFIQATATSQTTKVNPDFTVVKAQTTKIDPNFTTATNQ